MQQKPPISRQTTSGQDEDGNETTDSKPRSAIEKIKSALNFMRNQQFEVHTLEETARDM